ncbi:MAG: S41 family peptidase [Alphaproteobacteria bacterium]|nr:S41 family peptidase [Alphaproteobacteria bacterium]
MALGRPLKTVGTRPLIAAIIASTVLIGGCAAPIEPTPGFKPSRAELIFTKGFTNIHDKYIRQLDVAKFAFGGIKNLDEIDPRLIATRSPNSVGLVRAGVPFANFPAPSVSEPQAWAQLTTRAILAARERSPELKAANSETIFKAVFDGALQPLDHHSRYVEPHSARDYRAQREGFGGIGVHLSFKTDLPSIMAILPETPAAGSRLRTGDVISHVDGTPLEGLSQSDMIWRLRGHAGSAVRLRVTRAGQDTSLNITIKRSLIFPETVHFKRRGKVAIIRVTGFNQRTAQNLERVIVGLPWNGDPPLEGIILDLRGNPGGLLDQAVAVADAFLRKGRIVSTRGRHPESYQVFNATGRDLAHGTPMIVLINGRSASASEIVAAALQDRGRAVLVGSNSYGKGTVQNITRLPNDGELILTWSRFHAPSGYTLDDLGVLPNICTSNIKVSESGIFHKSMVSAIGEAQSLLSTWRTLTGFDEERRNGLRKKCPKTAGSPKLDLEIAQRILEDRRLYARTLGISAPKLAKGKSAGLHTK